MTPDDQLKIRIRVPKDLGLTKEQIAALKEKVKVEIVTGTMPVHGFTVQTPQQIVVQLVDDNNIY